MRYTIKQLHAKAIQKGYKGPLKSSKPFYIALLQEDTHLCQIKPMLAQNFLNILAEDRQRAEALLRSPLWIGEEKINGIRIKLHGQGHSTEVDTRNISVETFNYRNITANFPHIAGIELPQGMVLDGEIVHTKDSIDTGNVITKNILSSISVLVNSSPELSIEIQRKTGLPSVVLFDIIHFDNKKINRLQLYQRRRLLEVIYNKYKAEFMANNIHLIQQYTDPQELYNKVKTEDGEGVILKKTSSTYAEGSRNSNWLKWKLTYTVDTFITGYTPGKGKYKGQVGSLFVSVYDETGAEKVIGAIQPGADSVRRYITEEDGTLKKGMYYQVAEVMGYDWTKNIRMQHCTLIRFRTDKEYSECRLDLSRIKRRMA